MQPPLISVIIPNYNHRAYIERRIETVLCQSYKNLELILLDDASTDGSQEILRRYSGQPRVREIILNSHNSGSPFRQWEMGVGLSRGDWIWIAESDDYADEHFLDRMVQAIFLNDGAGLIYCDSRIVTGEIEEPEPFAVRKNKAHRTRRWSEPHRNSGLKEIEDFVLPYGTINNTSAVLFKRDVLSQANPFDIPLRYIGDKYAFIKVLANTDIAYIPEGLNFFRDPFNTKHAKRLLEIGYEQFLIFDWVDRYLAIDRRKFFRAFYSTIQISLYRGWTPDKRRIVRGMFRTNALLAFRCIIFNLFRPFYPFR
jgi:glycosyltransferase involved in cell wall biosynthesis